MRTVKLNSTTPLSIFIVSAEDHINGITGIAATIVIFISKNGGAFSADVVGAGAGQITVAELDYGWYKITPNDSTTFNTIGDLVFHITSDGDTLDFKIVVSTGTMDDVGSAVALDGGTATIAGMLTKMADDNSGADFNAATDSLTEIAATQILAPPEPTIATGGDKDTGNVISGTYATTNVRNSLYWQIQPDGISGSAQIVAHLDFVAPSVDHVPVSLYVEGRYQGGAGPNNTEWIEIDVYNFNNGVYPAEAGWERVSGITSATKMMHSTTDVTYNFTVNYNHVDGTGNMHVRFKGTSNFETGGTVDNLYLDYVHIDTSSPSSITPDEIAQAVWEHNLSQHDTLSSAGSSLRFGTGLIMRANIISVSSLSVFTIDQVPPISAAWDGHIMIVKHLAIGQLSCIPVTTVSDTGVVTCGEDCYTLPIVGDHAAIMSEVAVGALLHDGTEGIEDACDAAITANATVVAINAKTTNLPGDPAATSDITGLNNISTSDVDGAVTSNATIVAINAKTTNLPGDPAATSDITGLNNISTSDVDGAITANATIVAINGKTTNLPAIPASQGDISGLNNISTSDVNGEVAAALATYTAATTGDVTGSESVITGAISGLNNLSKSDVNGEVADALSDYTVAKASDVTGSESVITGAISGLNNLSKSDVNGEVADALLDYTAAKTSDVTSLNNLSKSDINGEVADALADYTAAKTSDVTGSESVVTGAISGLNNISKADVNGEVADALLDYTAAKTSDISGLNNISKSDVNGEVADALLDYTVAKTSDVTSLNNLSKSDVNGEVADALLDYTAAKTSDISSAVTLAISTDPTIIAIKERTDIIPDDPAAVSDVHLYESEDVT